jgi:hypothetical protein
MSRKSKDPVRNILMIAAGIAGIIVVTAFLLRLLMAPLYEEAAMANQRNSGSERAHHQGGSSGNGSNVNVDLAGFPWLLNWGLGWAWGGQGWHNNGWGWNNWGWGGGNYNNGGGWNGNVNNSVNRTYNDVNRDVNRNGGASLERNVERNVEHNGGGNVGRSVERNVEHGSGVEVHGRK